jgi:fructose-1,6-bisphosphatase I
LYSAATTLVISWGEGVYGFTLDEALGEFVLTHPYMKIPSRGKIYSFNEGNRWDWDEPVQQYITNIQKGCGETKSKYSGRLVGSMVADIHRTLQYGGIFGYPADSRNPNGKLRLLYEAAPMSFIVEQAGGRGTTGTFSLMDVQPSHVHQRVPCILGSRDDVLELESYYPANAFKSKKVYFGATIVADNKKPLKKRVVKMGWPGIKLSSRP